MFLSCRPFVVSTFSTGLVGVRVSSTPTRPVENVVLTTKGLQERNTTVGRDDVEKIGKIIN